MSSETAVSIAFTIIVLAVCFYGLFGPFPA
jgi:hypothetical protein